MARFFGLLAALAVAIVSAGSARAEFLTGLYTGNNSLNNLVTFDSATPATLMSNVEITGVSGTLIGFDYRPTDRMLYGISTSNILYTINTTTGVATQRALLSGATLNGSAFGIDFNPVPDLAGNPSLRVISNLGQNLRVNANTGVVAVDTTIGEANRTTSSAYANNDIDPATGTVLYGLDLNSDSLLRSTDANAGTYVTQGQLGVFAGGTSAFDISGLGVAYAALQNDGSGSNLYTVNLTSGQASLVGRVGGGGFALRGLASLPAGPVVVTPLPPTLLAALVAPALLGLARRRLF